LYAQSTFHSGSTFWWFMKLYILSKRLDIVFCLLSVQLIFWFWDLVLFGLSRKELPSNSSYLKQYDKLHTTIVLWSPVLNMQILLYDLVSSTLRNGYNSQWKSFHNDLEARHVSCQYLPQFLGQVLGSERDGFIDKTVMKSVLQPDDFFKGNNRFDELTYPSLYSIHRINYGWAFFDFCTEMVTHWFPSNLQEHFYSGVFTEKLRVCCFPDLEIALY